MLMMTKTKEKEVEEKRGGEVKSVTLGLYTQHMVVHVHAIKRTNTIMKVRGTTTREEGGGGVSVCPLH